MVLDMMQSVYTSILSLGISITTIILNHARLAHVNVIPIKVITYHDVYDVRYSGSHRCSSDMYLALFYRRSRIDLS